jgi:replicative DNA helicase
MIPTSTLPWRRYNEALKESLSYIENRANGTIKSLKTGWDQFDSVGMNGIEWGSMYVIASRPGVGKSLIVSSLGRQLQELNQRQDFYTLNFQFEMAGKNLAARELASANNLSLRYLLSAKDRGIPDLSNADLNKLKNYVANQAERKEFIVDTPMTVDKMKAVVHAFYDFVKKPFIVTLDHTLLVKKSAGEKSKQDTMENLSTMMIETKNALPITWIVLTQLNRDIDNAERQIPGKLSNYPADGDVYGSDFLMQCADVIIAYNRPAKYHLKYYGPYSYVLETTDKFLIAAHILKNRYGSLDIQWYRAEYAQMRFIETDAPKMKTK